MAAVGEPDLSTLPTVAPVDDVLADLQWRGLVAQTTDREALAADLAAGPLTLYCGFDPTADSLHVGNCVPLFALRRFQLAGHRADRAGRRRDRLHRRPHRPHRGPHDDDARGRRAAGRAHPRRRWSASSSSTARPGLLADNLEWTAPMSALDFLRDVGRHFPVNQMLARESVSARLESGGLSFTELSYQLLQSNDYVELYRRHGCRLQVGATDQWGNITAGLDLLRRVEGHEVRAHALVLPLVTDSSGAKIGKSTGGGSVWLDPAMTTPYALYQFALNVDDRDAGTYLRLLTFVGREEVEALDAATAERPQARAAQRRLARELVALVHGADEVGRVEAASAALFGSGELAALDEASLAAALAEAPSVRCRRRPPGGRAAGRGAGHLPLRRPARGEGGRRLPQQRPRGRRGGGAGGGGLAARPVPRAAPRQAGRGGRRARRSRENAAVARLLARPSADARCGRCAPRHPPPALHGV